MAACYLCLALAVPVLLLPPQTPQTADNNRKIILLNMLSILHFEISILTILHCELQPLLTKLFKQPFMDYGFLHIPSICCNAVRFQDITKKSVTVMSSKHFS